MHDYIREQLQREMTRKEFLQILTGILLSVFGFHNLLALLSGHAAGSTRPSSAVDSLLGDSRHGFGSRKFGD
jgi:hypothetical protein